MKKIISFVMVVCLMIGIFAGSMILNAKEPEYQISFKDDLGTLVGENPGLDIVAHSGSSQAAKFQMYNAAWAGRYGAAAFVIKGINIDASATKNRYMVMNVAVDSLASNNNFDNLQVLNIAENGGVVFAEVAGDALSSLHGAAEKEFQYIIVDLAWTSEIHLNDFRIEVKSSSLDKSADPSGDGHNCGFLYLRDISFFNTLDDAKSFVDPNYTPEVPGDTPGTDVDNPETGDQAFLGMIIALIMISACVVFNFAKKQSV